MSEEIESKRERSRNCPTIPLAAAIELAKKLYGKAGKAKIKAEVAVNALGYAGLNGASLSTLGALSQYGLIEREKGSIVAISQQAIRLMHPLNKEQESHALEELALNPKVFNELYAEGFNNGTEDLIANHLIQNGFMPDKAKKAATVFKANIELANLKGDSIKLSSDVKDEPKVIEMPPQEIVGSSRATATALVIKKNMLAQYTMPIGENEATVTITGEKLSVGDFDALTEYVEIWKRQFERKQKSELAQITLLEKPFVTKIKNGDFEMMVKIVGFKIVNGEKIYQDDKGYDHPSLKDSPNIQP
jgi:hypothetical protein